MQKIIHFGVSRIVIHGTERKSSVQREEVIFLSQKLKGHVQYAVTHQKYASTNTHACEDLRDIMSSEILRKEMILEHL